jgi:Rps23 Pro-64 3,4-dihydroxylase Tpa1-like proline 4-hydroxylase
MLYTDFETFNNRYPFPYHYQDNFLDVNIAEEIQREILSIPATSFDRYSNPFESKNTLRDKTLFPEKLRALFSHWESPEFICELSRITGYNLSIDKERNFWGVHTYEDGDKLDIHVDAGLHPVSKMKKQLTIGLYLSKDYLTEHGCHFEIWNGSNAGEENPVLYEKVGSIIPIFNRFIMFLCNDYSWHGNPSPLSSNNACKRIFVTMSYMSENYKDTNKRVKAYFIKSPCNIDDEYKDKLRKLRSDPERYKEVYKI